MPRETSWHIPTISSYNVSDATRDLNVILLQRMTELEQKQVELALETVDEGAMQRLSVAQLPAPRPLRVKKWIRDYFPSSANTLEIAKDAHSKRHNFDISLSSFAFVDSGWDMGNVIVAHWEQQEEGGEASLSAARVPMGIANVLLTACDQVEGMTLPHALGADVYERSKVDFYADLPHDSHYNRSSRSSRYPWPSHLPEKLDIDDNTPVIISLRRLNDATISQLRKDITWGSESDQQNVQIYNWESPEPEDRLVLRDLYNQLSYLHEQKSYSFFIDYMLQGPNGEPQILAASKIDRDPANGVELLPVFSSKFLLAREKAVKGESLDGETEIVDIWKKEYVDHLNTANSGNAMSACPIFFLHPFTQEQERRIRKAICSLGDVEDGEDWGHLFIWHGYIFDGAEKHTMQDLRDRFESCDPHSPFFDKEKAGAYRLSSYPHHFVAIDEKIFDPEGAKVWMASSLDFHGEDVSNELGWTFGRVDARETSIIFVNLDIANMGPEECLDPETVDRLWLSDLKSYREEDWQRDRDV